jgi:MEDS: MEthanogen/methylotroph, DcmR Sensory domain/Helix-turn-helix domain
MASKVQMSARLLNTKEAAGFLRVSEASIRRWGDAGLLPARRVGRRRERRFVEGDLVAFLGIVDAVPANRAPGLQTTVTVGGVPVPLHGHLCTFYNTDAGRLRLTVPFFTAGLRAGQPCFLVAAGEALDAYLEALRKEPRVDIDAAIRRGQFVTVPGPGTTVDESLAFWEEAWWRALADGPTVLRVVGEMASERRKFSSDAEMLRYEVAFNTLARRFPTVTLCQYDVREFDGEIVFQAIRSHPDLYSLHLGTFLS